MTGRIIGFVILVSISYWMLCSPIVNVRLPNGFGLVLHHWEGWHLRHWDPECQYCDDETYPLGAGLLVVGVEQIGVYDGSLVGRTPEGAFRISMANCELTEPSDAEMSRWLEEGKLTLKNPDNMRMRTIISKTWWIFLAEFLLFFGRPIVRMIRQSRKQPDVSSRRDRPDPPQ